LVKKVRTHSLQTVRSQEKQGILARVVRLKEAVHTGQSILLIVIQKRNQFCNSKVWKHLKVNILFYWDR